MGVQREIEFDYGAFGNLLLEFSRKAFSEVQEVYADHHFYLFGLEAGGKYTDVIFLANSVERLAQYASDAQKTQAEKLDISLRETMSHLRYSQTHMFWIKTWERFPTNFEKTRCLLNEREKQIVQMRYHNRHFASLEENLAISASHDERMNELLLDILRKLDAEQIFELTSSRSEVLVVLDYLPKCLAESPSIEELNPPEVVERAQEDLTRFRELDLRLKKAGWWSLLKNERPWFVDN